VKTKTLSSAQRGWTLLEVLAATIVVGLGLALFTRVQHSSSRGSGENSRILQAGKAIEQFLEDTRIKIAKDTTVNFPPTNATIAATAPNFIAIKSTVSNALSPVDGSVVANVKRLDITASWTRPYADSLKVTTYVSKRF
jgi:prepilin-type N-terminal cleavage/methylation domain-containing protein